MAEGRVEEDEETEQFHFQAPIRLQAFECNSWFPALVKNP